MAFEAHDLAEPEPGDQRLGRGQPISGTNHAQTRRRPQRAGRGQRFEEHRHAVPWIEAAEIHEGHGPGRGAAAKRPQLVARQRPEERGAVLDRRDAAGVDAPAADELLAPPGAGRDHVRGAVDRPAHQRDRETTLQALRRDPLGLEIEQVVAVVFEHEWHTQAARGQTGTVPDPPEPLVDQVDASQLLHARLCEPPALEQRRIRQPQLGLQATHDALAEAQRPAVEPADLDRFELAQVIGPPDPAVQPDQDTDLVAAALEPLHDLAHVVGRAVERRAPDLDALLHHVADPHGSFTSSATPTPRSPAGSPPW